MEFKTCDEKVVEYLESGNIFGNVKKDLRVAWGEDLSSCLKTLKAKNYSASDYYNSRLDKTSQHRAPKEDRGEIKEEDKMVEGSKYTIDDYSGSFIDPQATKKINQIVQKPKEDGAFGFLAPVWGGVEIAFYVFIAAVVAYYLWKSIKYILSFLYDVLNAHRLVYMQIVMPRLDGRKDREREKDVAKDMKEKIGRMAQVYRNLHKMGSLSVWDGVMNWLFEKSKFDLVYHYENGSLLFIIGIYPEYKSVLEGAISAQYSEASIEMMDSFYPLKYKHVEIMPMQNKKDNIYPIRTFKQLEDDPMNNILDAVAKISPEDTFTVSFTLKPVQSVFNTKAQRIADALYKKDISYNEKRSFWGYLTNPFFFLVNGPSQKLIRKMAPGAAQGDSYTRMIKAEEEAINTMGEEAGKPAFSSSLYMITTTNIEERANTNIQTVLSSFTIYKDEYNNELDQPEIKADIFGFIYKPMWKFSILFSLSGFFAKLNVFTINELASLYHLPDGIFNRTPSILRLEYKMLPPPDDLPVMKEENGFIISGVVAERYKKGKLTEILKGRQHWAVGSKIEEKIVVDKKTGEEKTIKKEVVGLKCFKDGTLLGLSVYRNQYTPVYIRKKDRSRHHYIIGKSGGGKSVYISSLARQDIRNGDGVCVIDPHGDLVEDIMEYIPKSRAKDIVYFDAGNEDRPMGLNLYEIDDIKMADRIVNDATEIFLKMFGAEIFGPRIQEYFKYGSLTLLEDMEEGATLIDVPRLFTDDAFREYKITKVKNPVVRNFWEKTYNAMGDREKQEIIPYFTSKFVSFITNRLIRNIIGQPKSAFKFREVMDSGKILLINLSKGKIGELNAQLLGMIIVSQLYNAAMSRADVPEDQRRDFFLYVDEFQNFVTGTFADILSEARKYHLALIMAHQYVKQLESGKQEGGKSDVKAAVFGNVGTMQSFKVGAEDAEILEKSYRNILPAEDIVGISNFKVYIALNINNSTARLFNMDTIWTQDYQNKRIAKILKDYSAKKYGRKVEFVDAEIVARLAIEEDEPEEDPDIDDEEEG